MERWTIEVDGVAFEVEFGGFDVPLGLSLPGGTRATLMPWTWADHRQALRELVWHDSRPRLDTDALARRILAASGLGHELHAVLAPLALWWAAEDPERVGVDVPRSLRGAAPSPVGGDPIDALDTLLAARLDGDTGALPAAWATCFLARLLDRTDPTPAAPTGGLADLPGATAIVFAEEPA